MTRPYVIPSPSADAQSFADAAARLAGAVAIVTWNAGSPQGILIKTVSLLSTRPPRVLFGVDKATPEHQRLLDAQTCAINLLSDADEREAERFAREELRGERFSAAHWKMDAARPPRLNASAAYLEGVIDQRIDAGSHSLFVVSVEDVEARDRLPLVHFDHGFRRLQPAQGAGAQVCAMLEA